MIKTVIKILPIIFLGVISTATMAQDSGWSKPDVQPLVTELVIELKVLIGAAEVIGESDIGRRQFIPITGGSFEGKDMQGEVLAGGADWQLFRPDGVLEIKAIYAIKTDDGQVITVDNRGLVDTSTGQAYVRTAPTFQAPKGKYEWLNRRIFTGTITPSPEGDFVIIRVFQIL